jgi:DNA-directed RNA polymerase subunit RPC12/RpoP
MFKRFQASLYRFMNGRYGNDQLNLMLMISALVLNLLSPLFGRPGQSVVNGLAVLLMGWGLYRFFSKRIVKRQIENRAFMNRLRPIRKLFKVLSLNLKSKTHAHYTCPHCGQIVRIPRGRGQVEITCPHCAKRFSKRS